MEKIYYVSEFSLNGSHIELVASESSLSDAHKCGSALMEQCGGSLTGQNEEVNPCFILELPDKVVVNATPHPLTFQVGEEVVVLPSSVMEGDKDGPAVINAKSIEKEVGQDLVKTEFCPDMIGKRRLDCIEAALAHMGKPLRIVGSIIAAQAYPGRVVGLCPEPGFERVPPQQKRMSVKKFTTFAE